MRIHYQVESRSRAFVLSLLLLSAAIVQSCVTESTDTFSVTGTVVFLSFEGGFYGIKGDDGRNYDPVNFPEEFRKEGLRIRFEAKARRDQASFHMWGMIVEIIHVQKL